MIANSMQVTASTNHMSCDSCYRRCPEKPHPYGHKGTGGPTAPQGPGMAGMTADGLICSEISLRWWGILKLFHDGSTTLCIYQVIELSTLNWHIICCVNYVLIKLLLKNKIEFLSFSFLLAEQRRVKPGPHLAKVPLPSSDPGTGVFNHLLFFKGFPSL